MLTPASSHQHALHAGGVAEQSIADSLSQQYELLPEIVRRWAVFRASLAAAASPGAGQQSLLSRPPPLASLSSDVRVELQVTARPYASSAVLKCGLFL